MSPNVHLPRAFAVWYKDFDFWEVRSLRMHLTNRSHWPTVPLSSLTHIRYDIVSESELSTGGALLLDKVSFDEGKVYSGKRTDTKMTQYRACPGDIVVSKINARKRAIGIVPDGRTIGISIHFRSLIPDAKQVDTEFLWMALRNEYCSNQFDIQTGGIGKGEISEERLMAVHVPLPPLPVQRAIVAHYDRAQKDAAITRERVRCFEQLLPLRLYQALGTPPPALEAASPKWMILSWSELERWSFGYLARARQGLLGFVQSRFPIVPLSECLQDTTNGYCIKPVSTPTPYQMLKLSALTPAGLDLSASKYVPVGDSIGKRFSLHKGDLLICRSVGSYDHVAKCALVEQDEPTMLFPDIIIRARFNDSVLPEYVREVVQSPLGRTYFKSNARTSVGMWKIGAEDIRNFPIPLPPLEAQAQIVARVREGRAEIAREKGRAESLLANARAEVEAMILGLKPPPDS